MHIIFLEFLTAFLLTLYTSSLTQINFLYPCTILLFILTAQQKNLLLIILALLLSLADGFIVTGLLGLNLVLLLPSILIIHRLCKWSSKTAYLVLPFITAYILAQEAITVYLLQIPAFNLKFTFIKISLNLLLTMFFLKFSRFG
ncbi:MAG: hypothetical protein UR26_C0001G0213 [candidate division TM6 bacterium GW2011_GWF2_32_72]|nr:MAG: hypothetical protein UR26_C0001G0213 [candidate division TM6 bacterium GW2011_GWF2_32_72]